MTDKYEGEHMTDKQYPKDERPPPCCFEEVGLPAPVRHGGPFPDGHEMADHRNRFRYETAIHHGDGRKETLYVCFNCMMISHFGLMARADKNGVLTFIPVEVVY